MSSLSEDERKNAEAGSYFQYLVDNCFQQLNVREGKGMKCEDRSMNILAHEDLECAPSTNSSQLSEKMYKESQLDNIHKWLKKHYPISYKHDSAVKENIAKFLFDNRKDESLLKVDLWKLIDPIVFSEFEKTIAPLLNKLIKDFGKELGREKDIKDDSDSSDDLGFGLFD
ncbi:hypothetical protein AC249_AIPGENE17976 [Exaiptasia diaphana]|nr:hypothetical protein AC249_AIPGENE17976 [Exaiptasia diaphana]